MGRENRKRKMLSNEMLEVFFETLSMLIKSGMPLHQCLAIMGEDAQDEGMKHLLRDLELELEKTYYLNEAMQETGCFPEYAIKMVKIGEASGKMETVSASLARYYGREGQTQAQIRSAVLNPLILICIMAVVIAFLLISVFPVFENVYSQFGVDASGSASINIGLVVGRIAMIIIFILLFIVAGGFIFSFTNRGKIFFAKFFAKFPMTRKFNYLFSVTQFTSALALQISSGADLLSSFQLCMDMVKNPRLLEKLEAIKGKVEAGDNIGEVLAMGGIYKAAYASLLVSGDRAGAIDEILFKIADMTEEEAENAMDKTLSLIEPALIGFLSVVIGVILICVMLPLIGIISSIG